MKKPPPPVSYEDRALVMKSKATAAEISNINKALARYDSSIAKFENDVVSIVNQAREIGIHFQTLCQHELIDNDFWKEHCYDKIECDYERAKAFVSLSRKIPKAVESIEEAVSYAQLALAAGGRLLISERTETQTASKVSVFEKFFCQLALVIQPFKKAIRDTPMEQWDKQTLETFISETEFLSMERERAMKLLYKDLGK